MGKIEAVFCDLGNVLVTFKYRPRLLFEIAQLVRPRLGERDFLDALEESRGIFDPFKEGEDTFWRLDIGRITRGDLYKAFLGAVDLTEVNFPPDRFWPLYFRHNVVIPETCAIVREVAEAGIPVIAATNGDGWFAADAVALDGGVKWAEVVMSWQVGYKKPALEFFYECKAAAQLALRSNGPIGFGQCLLIDDVPGYTAAFEGLGGRAVCFDATKQSASELRAGLVRLGVLPAA